MGHSGQASSPVRGVGGVPIPQAGGHGDPGGLQVKTREAYMATGWAVWVGVPVDSWAASWVHQLSKSLSSSPPPPFFLGIAAFRGPHVDEYTATPSRPKEEVAAVNHPPSFLVQCTVLSQRMMRDTLRRPVLLACHFVANVYFGSE